MVVSFCVVTTNLQLGDKSINSYPLFFDCFCRSVVNAEMSRKVGKNQVQVIRFILSGSTEDMLRIQADGKLDDWCRDSMDWLKKEYGEKNVVAATLHLDEEAPHIHASVVPIVQGERRKKKSKKE